LLLSLFHVGFLGTFAANPYPETLRERRVVERSKRDLVVGLWIFSTGVAAWVAVALTQRLLDKVEMVCVVGHPGADAPGSMIPPLRGFWDRR
jgi:hypothetical protein